MRKITLLACILTLIFTAAVAAGCGGEGDSGPGETLERFFKAVQEEDVDNAYSLVSEEDKKEFTKEQLEEGFLEVEAEYEEEAFDFVIGDEYVNGDEATVEVLFLEGDDSSNASSFEYILVKENGEWKISLIKTFEKYL
jgi:hypothetical protein